MAAESDAEPKEKHGPCSVNIYNFLKYHSSEIVFLGVVYFRVVHLGSSFG